MSLGSLRFLAKSLLPKILNYLFRNLLDQCHFSEQNAMFKSALFLSRDTYRASLPSRWLLDFSEPDQGVPGKPRTLLVLLSESASRDGQSASIGLAEIQDRDVTMVTAPFGKSRKLLPPTMYLRPVSRTAI